MEDIQYGSVSQVAVYHDGKLVGRESEVRRKESANGLMDAHGKAYRALNEIMSSKKVCHRITVDFRVDKKGDIDMIEVTYREKTKE